MLPRDQQQSPYPLRGLYPELSLLIQPLQGVDSSHGADIAELEALIIQVDLQLDEAIGMATGAEEQRSRANTRLNTYNENPQ